MAPQGRERKGVDRRSANRRAASYEVEGYQLAKVGNPVRSVSGGRSMQGPFGFSMEDALSRIRRVGASIARSGRVGSPCVKLTPSVPLRLCNGMVGFLSKMSYKKSVHRRVHIVSTSLYAKGVCRRKGSKEVRTRQRGAMRILVGICQKRFLHLRPARERICFLGRSPCQAIEDN